MVLVKIFSKWTFTNLKDLFLHRVPTLSISLLSMRSLRGLIFTSSNYFRVWGGMVSGTVGVNLISKFPGLCKQFRQTQSIIQFFYQ